jgi:hypothetical protein
MQLKIYQNDKQLSYAAVADVSAVPEMLFAVSQHHGSGTYEAREVETGDPVFRLMTEWLEGGE